MNQHDDAAFGTTATPDWSIAASAVDSGEAVATDDPFATAAQSAAAISADDEFAFASAASLEAASASASSAVAACASPSSAIVPAVPLADSAEYIAALEKRLARLHTRPVKKEFAHRAAGAEFLSADSTAAAATGSWLDLPDSKHATAASSASSSSSADAVAMAHSSDEDAADDEDTADRRRVASAALHAAVEERVALLTQHDQLMDDGDVRQLEEARRLAGAETAALDSALRVAGSDDRPSVTEGAASAAAASASSSSSSSSAAIHSMIARCAVPPGSHRVESSDGDDTAAPAHVHMSSAPGVDDSAALHSGALPLRALYYSSSACLAHAAGWWEDKQDKCVIT